MHYWANGLVHLWICSEGPLLTYDNIGHPFWIHFCCQMQLSSKNHNASIFLAMIVYIYTLTFKKIRTLCVLEDKFKVEQNWIQNRCKLLIDVRKGSYEHALMFTRPMSLQNFVEHSYIICSVQGGQNPPVQFCLGMIWELAFTYLYCLFLSFKMQKTRSLNIN